MEQFILYDGGIRLPCSWTSYLTYQGKMRRAVHGPFGFQLATWLNTTVWVPDPVVADLLEIYGDSWKDPYGGDKQSIYTIYLKEDAISDAQVNSSVANVLKLDPWKIVQLQDHLEQTYADQIEKAVQPRGEQPAPGQVACG